MSSVSFNETPAAVQAGGVQHHHHGHHRRQVIQAAAGALGMGVGDVQSALAGGTSLSQLAEQRGVSRDDLLKAIEQGLSSGGTGATTDTAKLQQVAQAIADRVPAHARPPEQAVNDGGLDVLA
jgi:hypothetical protein